MNLETKVDLLFEAVTKLHSRIDTLIEKQNFVPRTATNKSTTDNDYVSH